MLPTFLRYFETTVDARYVLKTFAERPSTIPEKYMFTCLDVIPVNISSLGDILSVNSLRLMRNCSSWPTAFIVSRHLTLSFPRKSNSIASSVIFTCSLRNVVAPTVSASSGSFSSPTLIAVLYMR